LAPCSTSQEHAAADENVSDDLAQASGAEAEIEKRGTVLKAIVIAKPHMCTHYAVERLLPLLE
jgi:hypothetical protein